MPLLVQSIMRQSLQCAKRRQVTDFDNGHNDFRSPTHWQRMAAVRDASSDAWLRSMSTQHLADATLYIEPADDCVYLDVSCGHLHGHTLAGVWFALRYHQSLDEFPW